MLAEISIGWWILCLSLFFITSCNPRVVSRIHSDKQFEAWDEKDGFVIYDEDYQVNSEGLLKIGSIKVTDSGVSVDCDYYSIITKVKKAAIQSGGNLVQIEKHKRPDLRSSCHRVSCSVYRVENLWEYEKEILWTSERKLRPRDFKGNFNNRPNSSRTSKKVKISYKSELWKNRRLLIISCYFDCENSYYNNVNSSLLELRIQQYSFDLSEIATRRIKQDLASRRINSFRELDKVFSDVYEFRMKELDVETDHLISELLENPTKEDYWRDLISSQLLETENFANFKLPLNI